MRARSIVALSLLSATVFSTFFFLHFNAKLYNHKKETYHQLRLCKQIVGGYPYHYRTVGTAVQFPIQLAHVPVNNNEIVVDVKQIDIRNVVAPYNGSLIENEDGYFLFFRYDITQQMHMHLFHSFIGCVELDKNFNQTQKDFITLNTNSTFSEDPRVIKRNGNISLIYNDLIQAKFYSRMMHIADVDFGNQKLVDIQKIDPKFSHVEKNWPPFIYTTQDGDESLHFEYLLFNPRKVFQFTQNHSHNWIKGKTSEELEEHSLAWAKKWGTPLGGTNARIVDGQYISFFHSKFSDKEQHDWYVMGAYTFENKPPFRITAISEAPILFSGIYESPFINTAYPNKFVIFPGGFAIEHKDQKTLLHLACGENDSAVKILTIDKDALLKSLKKIAPSENHQ